MFGHGVFGRKKHAGKAGEPKGSIKQSGKGSRPSAPLHSAASTPAAANEDTGCPPDRATKTVRNMVETAYAGSGDKRIDNVLNALGALAGFGCQMALREAFIDTGKIPMHEAMIEVGTNDGGIYYLGDALNEPLLDCSKPGKISVWSLVGGAVEHTGGEALPDIEELAGHVAGSLGSEEFGIPRLPALHMPEELPFEALKRHWPEYHQAMADLNSEPAWLGWHPALAAQEIILENKEFLSPYLAATIVMEAAVPMSRIDPKLLGSS